MICVTLRLICVICVLLTFLDSSCFYGYFLIQATIDAKNFG